MTKVDIYFDGACHNKKGSSKEPYGVGVAVFIDGEYSEVYSRTYFGQEGTSNIAEWSGCVLALYITRYLLNLSKEDFPEGLDIDIYSDSQLITNQYNSTWSIKEKSFIPYAERCWNLAYEAKWLKRINWIRRELNTKADQLSKRGLTSKRVFNLTKFS